MTIQEKLEQVNAAYELLKPFVNHEEFLAYKMGLQDAWALELERKELESKTIQSEDNHER